MNGLFQSYNITGSSYIPYQRQEYKTEKERNKLIKQAQTDQKNTPGSEVWIVEVTEQKCITYQVSEL